MTQVTGRRRWWIVLLGVLIAYLLLAYVLLPALWSHHEHEPGLASPPMVTRTADGVPGDALNVGLVRSRDDVLRAMHAAGWYPADPITLRTSIEIVGSVAFDRPYHDAPVSSALPPRQKGTARVREARWQKCGPAAPRPLLASARQRNRRPSGLARFGNLRPRGRLEPRHGAGDPPHRA